VCERNVLVIFLLYALSCDLDFSEEFVAKTKALTSCFETKGARRHLDLQIQIKNFYS